MITTLVDCGLGKEKIVEIIRNSEFSRLIDVDAGNYDRIELQEMLLSAVKDDTLCILSGAVVSSTNDNSREYEDTDMYLGHEIGTPSYYVPIVLLSSVVILLFENYFVVTKDRFYNPNVRTKINYPW